jgi:hypothetical protein
VRDALMPADVDDVAKTRVADEAGLGPSMFQHGVPHCRCAVEYKVDLGGRMPFSQ